MTQNEELAKDHRDYNTDNITQNKEEIRQLKITIVWLFLFIVALIFTVLYVYHDIHDCESKTYEHVTGQKAPTEKQLKDIP